MTINTGTNNPSMTSMSSEAGSQGTGSASTGTSFRSTSTGTGARPVYDTNEMGAAPAEKAGAKLSEAAHEAAHRVKEGAHRVSETAHKGMTRGADLVHSYRHYVKDRPFAALAVAFGAGYVIARILR